MVHTLSVLVENRPGALMRITSLFVRRGFNIESLAVGPTERHDVSRVTLRVNCEQHTLEQIEKQMHKLVNVLRVIELSSRARRSSGSSCSCKVTAPPDRRAELMALGEVFRARVVDLGPDALIFEVVGPPEELDVVRGARPAARDQGARRARAASVSLAPRARRRGGAHGALEVLR